MWAFARLDLDHVRGHLKLEGENLLAMVKFCCFMAYIALLGHSLPPDTIPRPLSALLDPPVHGLPRRTFLGHATTRTANNMPTIGATSLGGGGHVAVDAGLDPMNGWQKS